MAQPNSLLTLIALQLGVPRPGSARAGPGRCLPIRRQSPYPVVKLQECHSGLRRFHQTAQMHFVTFSCYRRQPKLATLRTRCIFEQSLQRSRSHPAPVPPTPVLFHLQSSPPTSVKLPKPLNAKTRKNSPSFADNSSKSLSLNQYPKFLGAGNRKPRAFPRCVRHCGPRPHCAPPARRGFAAMVSLLARRICR
jgi:hypothetical protein